MKGILTKFVICFFTLFTVSVLGCLEEQKPAKIQNTDIYKKCLEELKNESDSKHIFLGVEKYSFGEKTIDMCCAEVISENGTVKYCFDPIDSKLSPIKYRNFIFWKLKDGYLVKVLEGYEKGETFFWKSYDEDGNLNGIVEYYMKEKNVCAKFFNSEGVIVGKTCE
ncbi:MAG: hypothetical protein NZ879_04295 [Archaeoglobaceae archaeon]|nr:hypothetical protein [Archaeoglobaceae archaeon]MDW8118183.1 hypothetical protein [Archaeoglobaceae archaeon]